MNPPSWGKHIRKRAFFVKEVSTFCLVILVFIYLIVFHKLLYTLLYFTNNFFEYYFSLFTCLQTQLSETVFLGLVISYKKIYLAWNSFNFFNLTNFSNFFDKTCIFSSFFLKKFAYFLGFSSFN